MLLNEPPIPTSQMLSRTPDLHEIFIILFILSVLFVITSVLIICLLFCCYYVFTRLKRVTKSRRNQFDVEKGLNRTSNDPTKISSLQPLPRSINPSLTLYEFGKPANGASQLNKQTTTKTPPKNSARVSQLQPRLYPNLQLEEVQESIQPRLYPDIPTFDLVFNDDKRKKYLGHLFEDPEFPAIDSSLYYSQRPKKQIKWLRPWEIEDHPHFFVDGESRFDVVQGALGNCWMVAALAILTSDKNLFNRVVPPNQSFAKNYTGKFHFLFWRYGEWINVFVDDRHPTVDGKLYYMKSECHNEFWSALLEKAYAKLYKSYEALTGGHTSESLQDFTGGITEHFEVESVSEKLLLDGFQMGSLFGGSVGPYPSEATVKAGLLGNHAYSITSYYKVVNGHFRNTLLLRITWGIHEWKDAWSDECEKWQHISDEEKLKIKFMRRLDGEFWIPFEGFCKNFKVLQICHLKPEAINDTAQTKSVGKKSDEWKSLSFHGKWKSGTTQAFANNPQYCLSISPDSVKKDGKCTIVIGLIQKYRREHKAEGLNFLRIGFKVYNVGFQTGRQGHKFFKKCMPITKSQTATRREVTHRFDLFHGNYIIVPFNNTSYETAEFFLRIFCSGNINGQQLQ